MLAVLPVGLLPVLLLALLAAVEEDLATGASQSDLALFPLPVVHGTVCAGVLESPPEKTRSGWIDGCGAGHPH